MREKKKPLTEQELFKELEIYEEISRLESGADVRQYLRRNKENIKRYDIRISFFRKYPNLPLAISIVSLIISVARLLF